VPAVERRGEVLVWGSQEVPLAAVTGLHEGFDAWTGRAALRVEGAGWRIPLDEDYGVTRARLRRWLPDAPFRSDWMDGRFPALPAGLPPAVALALGASVALAVALALGWQLGWVAGLGAAILAAWPLGRLRDGWVVRPEGLRGGPPWAPVIPWYDVEAIHLRVGVRRAWLWTRGPGGGQLASVPSALLPAVRARVRRLGGLDLIETDEDLDDRYLRWRAPAVGIPWGVGAGAVGVAFFTATPWTSLVLGALLMMGLALLGLMVTTRSRGWGLGGVMAGTLLYAVVLLAVALSAGGWLGGS
jgi:hypothetical protein